MKKLTLILLFTIFALSSYAQGKRKTFNDANRVKNNEVYLNDTIVNKCDTAYIINAKTLNFYKSSSKDLKEIILLQEKRIVEQDKEYDELKNKFDSVSTETTKLIDRSDGKLLEVDNSLNKVNQELKETKELIRQTQEAIKEEKKQSIKTMIKWVAGGFTVGITSAALLFMMFK